MPFYEKGPVRIYYEEVGSGFPLFIIPGGGLNSSLPSLQRPFNPMEWYKDDFRCICADCTTLILASRVARWRSTAHGTPTLMTSLG